MEIILVDDGSTDSSPHICDIYAANDNRVTTIHQSNTGQSGARNTGIEMSTGEYLTFVDSDDWVALNMIEVLYNQLVSEDADISVCTHYKSYANRTAPPITHSTVPAVLSGKQVAINVLDGKMNSILWARLYKREIFKTIRFPVGMIYEDIAIAFDVYMSASKVIFTQTPMYYWRKRAGSTSKKDVQQIKDLLKLKAYEERHRRIVDKYEDYILQSEAFLCKKHIQMVESTLSDTAGCRSIYERRKNALPLIEKEKTISQTAIASHFLSQKDKHKIKILMISPCLFRFFQIIANNFQYAIVKLKNVHKNQKSQVQDIYFQ